MRYLATQMHKQVKKTSSPIHLSAVDTNKPDVEHDGLGGFKFILNDDFLIFLFLWLHMFDQIFQIMNHVC